MRPDPPVQVLAPDLDVAVESESFLFGEQRPVLSVASVIAAGAVAGQLAGLDGGPNGQAVERQYLRVSAAAYLVVASAPRPGCIPVGPMAASVLPSDSNPPPREALGSDIN